jgi:hypothetical protein
VGQNFLPCDREQELLLPPSLREWLPEEHLAWFVLDAVAEMDLGRKSASSRSRTLRSLVSRTGAHGFAAILNASERARPAPVGLVGLPARGSRVSSSKPMRAGGTPGTFVLSPRLQRDAARRQSVNPST